MTIYYMPEADVEQRRSLHKVRLLLLFIFMPLFLIVSYLYFNSATHSSEFFRVLWIGFLVIVLNLWNPFRRNIYGDIASRLQIRTVEIDAEGIRIGWMSWSRFIPWKDVTEVDEPPAGRGLYIRMRNRFVWYVIPRKNPHYEGIKSELGTIGIPISSASAPWKWGMLFVLFFCGSLLCNVLTQNRLILEVNLAVAMTLGVAGAAMTRDTIGDPHLRLRSMLGSFLPAVFAGISLLSPLWLK